MQDSVCHMTLKSHFISKFCSKTLRFRHQKTRRFYGHQLIDSTSGVALQQRYALKYKSDVGHENKGNIKFSIFPKRAFRFPLTLTSAEHK